MDADCWGADNIFTDPIEGSDLFRSPVNAEIEYMPQKS